MQSREENPMSDKDMQAIQESLLIQLSQKLGCDVDEVRFLFTRDENGSGLSELLIPDMRA